MSDLFSVEIENIAAPVQPHEPEEVPEPQSGKLRCAHCRFNANIWLGRQPLGFARQHDEWVECMNSTHAPELIGHNLPKNGSKPKEVWLYRMGDPLPTSTFGNKETRSNQFLKRAAAAWDKSMTTGETVGYYWLALEKRSKTSWHSLNHGLSRFMVIARTVAYENIDLLSPEELNIETVIPDVSLVNMAEHLIKSYSLGNTRHLLEARTKAQEAKLALELIQAWEAQITDKLGTILLGGTNAPTP